MILRFSLKIQQYTTLGGDDDLTAGPKFMHREGCLAAQKIDLTTWIASATKQTKEPKFASSQDGGIRQTAVGMHFEPQIAMRLKAQLEM
eukprot:1823258-Amphidinium_carterae.1